MKRFCLIVFLFVLAGSCLFATTYFEVYEDEDEWGDKTGASSLMMLTDDFEYSNSYSYDEPGFAFVLYFYPQYKAICGGAILNSYNTIVDTFIVDDVILVKYRDADKNVTEVKTQRSYNENATFALIGSSADELIKTIKATNKIQFIIKGTDYESDTKYNVIFEYDPEEFSTYFDKIGWK
jgi:hypothetical protein